MESTSLEFRANARAAIANPELQRALSNVKTGFQKNRLDAIANLPEFEDLRDIGRDVKNHTLTHLDFYLEQFETKVKANGGQVHWAQSAEEARNIILGICQDAGAKTVTKGKSMVTEEMGLNEHLAANGIEPIETDLGEYIIQLRGEHPSHIIAPAIHLNKDQVSDAFHEHHQAYGLHERLEEPTELMAEARQVLRSKFVAADVGITGANFCVAETGTTVIVTNEGNGDLTQTLPKVHIAVTGIEKVIPTLEDLSVYLRLLARSATGQETSVYTTLSTGPRRENDIDGPQDFHVVLVDNGRSGMLGGEFQDMLRCIRCAACMNHCPVYASVGGHAYGWVYPGPMGSVLTPQMTGIAQAGHLPNASTFCGRCEAVCPMRIPLPKMMRHWREKEFEQHLNPASARYGLKIWAALATRPRLYGMATSIAANVLKRLGGKRRSIRKLLFAGGWTGGRDLPAPQGKTFQKLWAEKQRSEQ